MPEARPEDLEAGDADKDDDTQQGGQVAKENDDRRDHSDSIVTMDPSESESESESEEDAWDKASEVRPTRAVAKALAELAGLATPELFALHGSNRKALAQGHDESIEIFPRPDADARSRFLVPGLHNLGNSCFINALLQAMASCAPVVAYVDAVSQANALAKDDAPTARAALVARLAVVLRELSPRRSPGAGPGTLNIRDLRHRLLLLSPAFRYSEQQQDADELLHLVLDAVDTERLISRKRMHRQLMGLCSIVKADGIDATTRQLQAGNPLHGSVMSQMMCATCGSISPLRASTMHVVPLPLIEPSSGATLRSLDAALRAFVAQETVEGVECFGLCNKQRRNMFRRSSLGRMPPVLCLHLGRRHYSPAMGRIVKLAHHVSFPETCVFSHFAFHQNELQRGLMSNFAALGSGLGVPSRARVTSPDWFVHGPSHVYELSAVIVHHGSAHGGHFTAFRRLTGSVWVHVSDARVVRVSLASVLQTQAYMLFYSRREVSVAEHLDCM